MQGHTNYGYVRSVSIIPDKEYIVTADWSGNIIIWNFQGIQLKQFKTGDRHNCLIYHNEDELLVLGNNDGSIAMFNLTGESLHKWMAHSNRITEIISLGQKGFLSTSTDQTIKLWTWNGELLHEFRLGDALRFAIYSAALSPDGSLVALNTVAGVFLLDLQNNEITEDKLSFSNPWAIQFIPTGLLCDGNRIYELNGTVIHQLGNVIDSRQDIGISSNGDFFVVAGFQRGLDIWDKNLRVETQIKAGTVVSLAMSKNDLIATGGMYGAIDVWNRNGRELHSFHSGSERIFDITFALDDKTLITAGRTGSSGEIMLWDLSDLREPALIRAEEAGAQSVAISPDGLLLASGFENRKVFIDYIDGSPYLEIPNLGGYVTSLTFSRDGQLLATRTFSQIRIWNLAGDEILSIRNGDNFSKVAFSPCGNYMAAGDNSAIVKIWNLDGLLVHSLEGHTGGINSVRFTNNGKHLYSASKDGTTRIWNLDTGTCLILLTSGEDWIIFNEQGYFDASIKGGRLLSMVEGQTAYGIEQFSFYNNRPDILLNQAGFGTEALIEHFYSRYIYRLMQNGLSHREQFTSLDVPTTTITDVSRSGKYLEISFDLRATSSPLSSYQIFVNDVAIYGRDGKNAEGMTLSATERLELTNGRNRIEVACWNSAGVESYRAMHFTEYDTPHRPDLYFLAFGVSEYQDPNLNLKWAAKDVKDLEGLFSSMKGYHFPNVYSKIYTDSQVTVENIIAAKDFSSKAKVDDIFILFIAGHGVYDVTDQPVYYYLTHDADLENLAATCADFDTIEELLDGIAPRRKLFLMDTCESGELEDIEFLQVAYDQTDSSFHARTIKDRGLAHADDSSTEKSYEHRAFLMRDRYIYNSLNRRTGAIVFSSSQGGELSWECDERQNGLFTAAILESFHENKADRNFDNRISIDELHHYVSKRVAEISKGLQNPVIDRDNLHQSLVFPVYYY